jgi:hypothetical protein
MAVLGLLPSTPPILLDTETLLGNCFYSRLSALI